DIAAFSPYEPRESPRLQRCSRNILAPDRQMNDRDPAGAQALQQLIGSEVEGDERTAEPVRGQTGDQLGEVRLGAAGTMKVVDEIENRDSVGSHGCVVQVHHVPGRAACSISTARWEPSGGPARVISLCQWARCGMFRCSKTAAPIQDGDVRP